MMNANDLKAVEKGFKPIDIDDLPQFSSWPARLLGISDWETRVRNEQLVKTEYGQKWGDLSAEYRKHNSRALREALEYLFTTHFQHHILFHIEEKIYRAENSVHLWDYFYTQIMDVLGKHLTSDDTLVELGCGWGRNLLYALDKGLCRRAIGGEYTEEGQKFGQLIAKQFDLPLVIKPFDYYKPAPEFMKSLKDTVVFTHNSIEQISYLPEETIKIIATNQPKAVIHFEPVYEYRTKDTMLHYMWKKYTEVNDYNRNLLTVLKKLEQQGLLNIVEERKHSLGLNAFNPGSYIVWQPA
jgi:hypothetical protein